MASRLELRKGSHGHHRAKADLEGPILRHHAAQVSILDVLLHPVERENIVALRCSPLSNIISMHQLYRETIH